MTLRARHRPVLLCLLLCSLILAGCGKSREAGQRYTLHMQRGVEAYARGDYGRALSAFQKALEFDKDAAHPYLYIAELHDDYLDDKLEAIIWYREFLKRSSDEALDERVKKWISEAETHVAGIAPSDHEAGDGSQADPEQLKQKLANALIARDAERKAKERSLERLRQLEGGGGGRTRPQLFPWLLAGLLDAGIIAVLVVRTERVPLKQWLRVRRARGPTLKDSQVAGRYFWVENEFNLGSVSIVSGEGKLRVESISHSTNSCSTGYGSLVRNTLKVELTNNSGLQAPTTFRFAPDGMSFTAEWTDDLGPGMAIGVRER